MDEQPLSKLATPSTDDASNDALGAGDVGRWHELVSKMGAEIAAPLTSALERIHALTETGQIDRLALRTLREEVEQARQVGMTGQQLSRFASGRVRLAPERLQLADIVNGVLAHRTRETRSRGIVLKPSLQPAVVVADASLLFSLLNTTIDWALAHARSVIEFAVETKTWPVRARLVCRFTHRPPDEPGHESDVHLAAQLDSLAWRLIEQTAWSLGLVVERQDRQGATRVAFEFVRTVDEALGDAFRMAEDEAPSTNSKALAGSHVLVISARRPLRAEVREAVRSMNLVIDFVASIKEAAAFCRDGLPHAVLVESIQVGERFAAFRGEILAEVPSLAFVEIVEEGGVVEMSGLDGASGARVGRSVLAESLQTVLLHELSKGL